MIEIGSFEDFTIYVNPRIILRRNNINFIYYKKSTMVNDIFDEIKMVRDHKDAFGGYYLILTLDLDWYIELKSLSFNPRPTKLTFNYIGFRECLLNLDYIKEISLIKDILE